MVTRARDLYTFQFSNSNDVHLADCGDGLQVAFIGTVPERRLLLETICAFIVLKNGVLIGYGANTALFGSSEVAYTVFDTFRSGEAAWMYCRVLATVTRMFGSNTFMIDTYQLGEVQDAVTIDVGVAGVAQRVTILVGLVGVQDDVAVVVDLAEAIAIGIVLRVHWAGIDVVAAAQIRV